MSPDVPTAAQKGRGVSDSRRASLRRVHLLLLVFAAIVVIDALVGDGGLLAMMRAQKQYQELSAGLERLTTENHQLREENRRLREDPAALEEAARRDLSLMKPGEKVFIIKDLTSPHQP